MTRKIRIGKSRDIPIIADYNIAMAMETEGKTLDKEIITAGVNSIINDNSKGVYWVVEIEEELVGQLMITYEWSDWRNGTMWWIQSVYVSEDFRRQGIYTSLYENLINLANKHPRVSILQPGCGVGGHCIPVDPWFLIEN